MMRGACLIVSIAILAGISLATGPQWTLAHKRPRLHGLRSAFAARKRSGRLPALTSGMGSSVQGPRPTIAVYSNETHLLVKLKKGDKEHCAAFHSVSLHDAEEQEAEDEEEESGRRGGAVSYAEKVVVSAFQPSQFDAHHRSPKFFGVFGLISTTSGHFLGLISKVEPVLPEIFPDLLEIKEVKLIPVPGQHGDTPRSGAEASSVFEAMNSAFRQHSFCFSQSTFDPTHTLQWNCERNALSHSQQDRPAWRLANRQFFWNQRLLKPIMDAGLDEFITPVANWVIHSTVLPFAGKKEYQNRNASDGLLVLVSRRSSNNQGQRYIKRGADAEGNVANFVETEQIFRQNNVSTFAYTQIRGSIPLFWKQLDKYKLRPKIKLSTDSAEQLQAMSKHIDELEAAYLESNGSPIAQVVTFVNLIDKIGDQGRLGRQFRRMLAKLKGDAEISEVQEIQLEETEPSTSVEASEMEDVEIIASYYELEDSQDTTLLAESEPSHSTWREELTTDTVPERHLKHLWFDFHNNCKNRQLQSLQRLYPAIFEKRQPEFLSIDESMQSIRSRQRHIVRTNCIDCLDRTNVVQSVIARWALRAQLKDLGLLSTQVGHNDDDSLSLPNKDVERAFRTLWAKNGDAVSLLYAGSPALKRDITILGKRTSKGMLEDGFNALLRYYINNFKDEQRQHAVNLLLGVPTSHEASSMFNETFQQATRVLRANARPALIVGLVYLTLQLMYPSPQGERTT